MERIRPGSLLAQLLDWCHEREASDLHVQAGKPYVYRVHGQLDRIPSGLYPAPDESAVGSLLREGLGESTAERVQRARELDLSFYLGQRRYRANFSKQQGSQSCSFRAVPQQRLKLADLDLPPSLLELVAPVRGIVLLTGPTGQGKSTTVRALLQELNESRAVRIITIEDPIEYVFEDRLAQFEQREVGIDTDSFAHGIRNAMRQDPNVIFVGEIRDRESIFAALQAAETGHLVLTTLHADSVPQAISRLREHYPAHEQDSVSALLARNLAAIVCQRLIPNVRGTRTPCLEVLRRDAGVEQAVRTNELHLLEGIIESAVNVGMHSFDQYLLELLSAGIVTETVAREFAVNKHRLELLLRGIVTTQPILRRDDR